MAAERNIPLRFLLPFALANTAFAEDKLSVQLNHSLYSLSKFENERNDSTQKLNGTALSAPEVVLNLKPYHLHLYPTASSSPIGLGFDLRDDLEIGVSYTHLSNKSNGSKDEYLNGGIFLTYVLPAGPTSFEAAFSASSVYHRSEVENLGSSREKGHLLSLSLTYVQPLAYGASFLVSAYADKSVLKDSDGRSFTNTSRILSPLGIRVDF